MKKTIAVIGSAAALSFARAISEYGSLVLLSGSLPFKTQVASVRILGYLEGGDRAGAGDHEPAPLGASIPALARRRHRW